MSSDTTKAPDMVEAVADAIGAAWNSAPYVGWDELSRAAIAALAATQVDAGPEPATPLPWFIDHPHCCFVLAANGDGIVARIKEGEIRFDERHHAYVMYACNTLPILLARCAALEAERDAAVARAEELDAAWEATGVAGQVRGLGVSLAEVVQQQRTDREELREQATQMKQAIADLRQQCAVLDEYANPEAHLR